MALVIGVMIFMYDFIGFELKGKLGKEKESQIIFLTEVYSKDVNNKKHCLVVDVSKNKNEFKKTGNYGCYVGARVSSLKDVFFCLDKKLDFIINPFNYKTKFFDNSTITVMKQRGLFPLIFIDEYLNLSRGQQIGFLKNAFLLVDLAKKQSIPVFIASGAKEPWQVIYNNEFLYPLFNIKIEQANNFFNILERK